MSSEELRTLANERQADLRREAETVRLIRREGVRRPIRIVQPTWRQAAATAVTALALAGTLRMEH
jgi:hypothetical protein